MSTMTATTKSVRITYAPDIEACPRAENSAPYRPGLMDLRILRRGSMSKQGRKSIDPSIALPPVFKTLSFGIDEQQKTKTKTNPKSKSTSKDKKAEIEFDDLDYHKITAEDIYSRFSSSSSRGLSSEQIARKITEFGLNAPSPPPSQWFKKTIGYLFGGFGAILFIACILVFIAWKPLGQPPAVANLALAIVLALVWLIQAAFSFWQDFSASRVMASISGMLPDSCMVLRDGQWKHTEGRNIVPGDVVKLQMGDKMPADVRLVEVSSDVRFDRSVLTGETMPLLGSVDSTDNNYLETACIGFAGTHCVSGSAVGVVVSTGDRTVFGRIAKLTSAPKPGLTPLQKEILYFVSVIVCLMLTMILIVIIVWATWLRKSYSTWISVPALIVDCVSVAVAFIPEGLPIAVTASLTITAAVMKKNKVLCKSLKTVETLGAVDVICSDKTGTLTKNQMTVTDYLIGVEEEIAIKAPGIYGNQSRGLAQLALLSSVCNNAEFVAETCERPLSERKINGDATDQAILRFAESMTPVNLLRTAWQVTFRIAFNSKSKFMINVIKSPEQCACQESTLTIKGAPDVLLPRCSAYMAPDGSIQPLHQARQTIESIKNCWSAQGKRVLLLAQKPLESTTSDPIAQPREYENEILGRATSGLILVGLVGIVDPPRDEIPEVVNILRGAGVRVFMLTGDFKITAAAIARQCGIITSHQVDDVAHLGSRSVLEKDAAGHEPEMIDRAMVMSGADLEDLDNEQWSTLCRYREIVFARTTPEHKLRIVKELQSRELTVGMTGDGVNDAPSLKQADVGIAMGNGSQVALEASDMVLLDSFAAIIEAVRYGRVVYDNLKKTVCYLLPAGSFSEFWPVMTNVLFGMPQILSSFLMIIICCFTDCAAATAIAYEAPEADVMTRRPRNARKDRLVDWKLILQAYGFIGIIETALSFTVSFWYCQKSGLPFSALWFGFGTYPDNLTTDEVTAILNTASSIYFVNLVVMQWFSLLALRTRRLSIFQHPVWHNWYLGPAILFSFVIAIVFLYPQSLHTTLGTATVPMEFWFLPMAFGVGIVLLDEGRKFGVRKYPKGFLARIAW